MDTWKISKNSDSATQDALSDFIVEVNMSLPSVKANFFETYGLNGSIDETEALGGVNYSDREVTLFLVTKSGISNPKFAVGTFINTYVGGKIRLHNTTHSYMLIGRITDVRQIKTKVADEYKLVCTVVCEPLRYYTTYSPSATGTDLRPTAWSENLWNSTNVTGTGVTASGATIVTQQLAGENHSYYLSGTTFTTGQLVRIYLQNLVNCTIEVRRGERVLSRGSGSHIIMADGVSSLNFVVYLTDVTQDASFGCIIRTIDTTIITTDSKAVPLQIESTFVPYGSPNYPVKMFINDTIFTVKPDTYSGTWKEYAPAMLKTGTNYIATFVDISTYSSGSGVLNVRYRGGVL